MTVRRLGLVVVVLLLCAGAQAEDRLTVRALPGYPLPNQSFESLELRVSRNPPSAATKGQEIDRFFASVQAALVDYGIVRDWQLVIPDAPWIEITIELDGRRTRLASAHIALERSGKTVVTERGAEALGGRSRETVLAQQSDELRRYRGAFEKLLALALDRARAQLAP